jgi:adenylyl-sulfate kinase
VPHGRRQDEEGERQERDHAVADASGRHPGRRVPRVVPQPLATASDTNTPAVACRPTGAPPARVSAGPGGRRPDELGETGGMSAAPRPGVTVFLTGLSGAGKSTIADALVADLEAEGRPVTVLDGDVVRTHLSSELSFSREDRDLNIRRIGFVAGEVVKHGGTVVVAAIAPYEAAREEARALVERHGRFVLVHLSTPLEVCEGRDVKGLYARARAGQITGFTGIDDPYEPPARAEVVIDTSVTPLTESVARIREAMNGAVAPVS